jgi:hypothetical protein
MLAARRKIAQQTGYVPSVDQQNLIVPTAAMGSSA